MVRGSGTASAEPDLVVLAFQVAGQDHAYASAIEKLNERVRRREASWRALGLNGRVSRQPVSTLALKIATTGRRKSTYS
jgi:uncharacterized protein YggE